MRNQLIGLALLVFLAAHAQANPPAPLVPGPVPQGMGVNIHFTNPAPGEMKQIAAAGFTWVRMDYGWGSIEREKGKYDFAEYDGLLKALDEYKIRPIFILDYSNPHYDKDLSPSSDEGRAGFAKWAAASAVHFKGHGVVWEMYNEPNIFFWRPKPDAEVYAKLALAVGKALREAAPEETYIGPATSEFGFPFIETCFKAGCLEYWSAVSTHPYRRTGPETAVADYNHLADLIAKYAPAGKKIPIISGEWGFSSAWNGFDIERQGRFLPREFLSNLAYGIPLSIWYDWHDDGTDPKESEHHFGTVFNAEHRDRAESLFDPKPAYIAARVMTTELRGYGFEKRLLPTTGGDEDFILLFKSGDNVKLAAWTMSHQPHEVTLPSDAVGFKVVSHLGAHLPEVSADGQGLKLTLTDAPQYLTPAGPNAKLSQATAWQRSPVEIVITAQPDAVLVTLAGKLPAGFRGKLEVTQAGDPTGVQPIAAGASDPSVYRFESKRGKDGLMRVGVRILRDDGSVLMTTRTKSLAALDDLGKYRSESPITSYKAIPDGDDKVRSDAMLTLDAKSPTPDFGAAMRLHYSFDKGWKFMRIDPQGDAVAPIPGKPESVGLWAYGDASNNVIRSRFVDSTGQTFQSDGHRMEAKGWHFVRFSPTADGTSHWGGANDGKIHLPLKVETLVLVDSGNKEKSEGTVYFAAPTVYYEE